jgi:hypothetical protein
MLEPKRRNSNYLTFLVNVIDFTIKTDTQVRDSERKGVKPSYEASVVTTTNALANKSELVLRQVKGDCFRRGRRWRSIYCDFNQLLNLSQE